MTSYQVKNIRAFSKDELESLVNIFLKEIGEKFHKIQQQIPEKDGMPHFATIFYFDEIED